MGQSTITTKTVRLQIYVQETLMQMSPHILLMINVSNRPKLQAEWILW